MAERVVGRSVRLLAFVFLALLAATTVYPFVFLGLSSFKTLGAFEQDPLGPPRHPTFANIQAAWTQTAFGRHALNTALIVSVSVIIITVVASTAGFAFAHLRVPLRRTGLIAIIALMLLPGSVLMIPTFRTVQQLGLVNHYTGLILVYGGLMTPFAIYMMYSFFRRLPAELLDAAEVDGASILRTFTTIALPLARPAITTLVTLNAVWLWNEFLFALLILQTDTQRTVTVSLSTLSGQYSINETTIAAGLFLAIIPPLAIYAIFQRRLVSGLTAGALK